ncbi:ABC transporter substrate-binding protein [Gemmobacter fulvus]|uniref:ABC transporter substrate-binding protein n=1 Tax=Gemmobacter fulvus TaxID=2840474 RepID=UPI0027967859|nr:ABC transporter substrate-binding protein [Gemmobacter fulvus]MDQ1850748.1 ABC transporter substrate-binding protein [Gemmobacter fulvus]
MTGASALAGASMLSPIARTAWAAGSDAPIKIGAHIHLTGIGSTYGRWNVRTAEAAIKAINDMGGISGRPVELVVEDDGTDARRGAEVTGKLITQHECEFIVGALFEFVMFSSWPVAHEAKVPYFLTGEATELAAGEMSRWVFQPGSTDVRAQIQSIGSFVGGLGKKVTMLFPDYAFGFAHRNYFSEYAEKNGITINALIAIPPTETSITRYLPQVPSDTDLLYHVLTGPSVLTYVREMGEHFGANRPQFFGFMDSIEGVDIASPGLEYLEGTYFWEGMPRYTGQFTTDFERFYREQVGVTDEAHAVGDPRDVPTYAHMHSPWQAIFTIKDAIEASGYRNKANAADFVAALEEMTEFSGSNGHPQGRQIFNGKMHQSFGSNFISRVEGGRLNTIAKTEPEDGLYETDTDYTVQSL